MKQSRKIRRSWLRVIPEWMRCFARSVLRVIKLSSSRVIKSAKTVGESCATFARAINSGLRTLNSGLKAHTKEWAAAALVAGLIVAPYTVDLPTATLNSGLRTQNCLAAPEGGTVVGGNATINAAGSVTTISQTSQRAAIDWTSFDIAKNETVNFQQPNAQAIALNRILGNNPTAIYGQLNANGQVYLSNPNGMLFAPGAQINVAGLIATTSHVDPLAFMQTGLINTSERNAAINMQGSIFAVGGLVEIKGATAINVGGIIRAVKVQSSESRVQSLTQDSYVGGGITLGGAQSVTNDGILDSGFGGLVGISASSNVANEIAVASINGNINAAGGTVAIDGDLVGMGGAINLSGASGGSLRVTAATIMQTANAAIQANGTAIGGNINYQASEGALLSGSIQAEGAAGGAVEILAKSIDLLAASISARGITSGGQINIGGDWQGKGERSHAETSYVNSTTVLDVAATAGQGGTAVVWSDNVTEYYGTIQAFGQAGQGGAVEVSGLGDLRYAGAVNAGSGGKLLLDPKNITVAANPFQSTPLVINQSNVVAGTLSVNFGKKLTVTNTGNYMIGDRGYSTAGVTGGAVFLFNATSGALTGARIGSHDNDAIGATAPMMLINNGTATGKYVFSSTAWDGDKGAATFVDATSLTDVAAVASTNSLVGTKSNDRVGSNLTALTNGNYVVGSYHWANGTTTDAGAATWCSGSSGLVGEVSSLNSLVGTQNEDYIGIGVTALTNGNYLVSSQYWNNRTVIDAGAVAWGNGASGSAGALSATNSLVGTTTKDQVGSNVVALTNGNYVVGVSGWDNGAVVDVGAATWGSGSGGLVGEIAATNSLVGTKTNDRVGSNVIALTNGNYVVGSPAWDNGTVANAGAATWGSGSGGLVGTVSSTNSLVGTSASDRVGSDIIALKTNGNYVVGVSGWDNGAVIDVGAATWGSGSGGLVGAVSTTNSISGTQANDYVGSSITALTNGNYVVGSYYWNNGTVNAAGAVTWGNGATGSVGAVAATNSLVGTQDDDNIGTHVTALANGNYVVGSENWNNGTMTNAGAATWVDGAREFVGTVSVVNSLVGSQAEDYVGLKVTALSNGSYVVVSEYWANGAATNAGAATWGSGTTGVVGVVSAINSLVGTQADENIGSSITSFTNGNYVVRTPNWNNGTATNAGAVTWGNGASVLAGAVSSANSLIGTQTDQKLGTYLYPDSVNERIIVADNFNKTIFAYCGNVVGDVNVLGAFASQATASLMTTANTVTNSLNAGTDVTFKANNDIMINQDILSSNLTAGEFNLYAGRNININADIRVSALSAVANATEADGVIAANRDAGAGSITMAPGTTLTATSDVTMTVSNGFTSGTISLASIVANSLSLSATNLLFQNNVSATDLILNAYGSGSTGYINIGSGVTISGTGVAGITARPLVGAPSDYFQGYSNIIGDYQIYDYADLNNVRNDTGINVTYTMKASIDAVGESGFEPIGGNELPAFQGVFDGNNNTLSNLSISSTALLVGLFGELAGNVKNLNLDNVNIAGRYDGDYQSANLYVGAIAGQNNFGNIQNITINNSTISANSANLTVYVGAVAGQSRNWAFIDGVTVNNSLISGDSVNGEWVYSGGIVGDNNASSVYNSKFNGVTITGTNIRNRIYTGGVAGNNYSADIAAVTADDLTITAVSGHGSIYVGGIAGWSNRDIYDISLNNMALSGTSTYGYYVEVGGIVADNNYCSISNVRISNASITNSSSSGDVYSGGVAASSNESVLCDIKLDNVTINGSGVSGGNVYSGGVAGWAVLGSIGNEAATVSLNNITIDGNSVSGSVLVGGIVGSNGTESDGITAVGANISYANSSGVTASAISDSGKVAVGGIAGQNYYATISSVSLSQSAISGSSSTGAVYVGGVAGQNYFATISSVSVSKPGISGSSSTGDVYVGGAVGYNSSGMVSDVVVSGGTINGSNISRGGVNVGGVAGSNYGEISGAELSDLQLTGSDGMNGSVFVGGVAGTNVGTISKVSFNAGKISNYCPKNTFYVGGLAGANYGAITGATLTDTNIIGSSFTGAIYAGGMVGYNGFGYGTSASIGNISLNRVTISGINATGTVYAGGMTGRNHAGTIGSVTLNGVVLAGTSVGGVVQVGSGNGFDQLENNLFAKTTAGRIDLVGDSVALTGTAATVTQLTGAALTLGTSTVNAGGFALTATGRLTQSGALIVGETFSINTGSNDALLDNRGNDFNILKLIGGTVTVYDSDELKLGTSTVGNLSASAAALVINENIFVANNMALNAYGDGVSAGYISSNGGTATVGGKAYLAARPLAVKATDFVLATGGIFGRYSVYDYADLNNVRNDMSVNATYNQLANIDASATEFVPIGNNTDKFKGKYDGGGNSISDLVINQTAQYVGLFGYVEGAAATIGNLNLVNARINGHQVNDAGYVGGVVGYNNEGTISKVTVSGSTIRGEGTSGGIYVGGFAGLNYSGTISDSTLTDATLSGSCTTGYVYAGGGAGYDSSGVINGVTISGGTFSASSARGYAYVGGVAGYHAGTISDVKITGTVLNGSSTSGGSVYVGGLVGYNSGNSISNVILSAETINASNTSGGIICIGGVAGDNDSGAISAVTITDAIINASAVGNGYIYAGGVAGFISTGTINNVTISSSTISASVSSGGVYVGGAAGYKSNGVISNVTVSGATLSGANVSGAGKYAGGLYVGGLVAYNNYGAVNGGDTRTKLSDGAIAVNYTSGGNITVGMTGTAGTITQVSEGSLTLAGANISAGGLTIGATGAVSQSDIITVNGPTTVTAGDNNINLSNAANNFTGNFSASGGAITVAAKTALTVANISGSGTVLVNYTGVDPTGGITIADGGSIISNATATGTIATMMLNAGAGMFNNLGAADAVQAPTGRWQVYAIDDSKITGTALTANAGLYYSAPAFDPNNWSNIPRTNNRLVFSATHAPYTVDASTSGYREYGDSNSMIAGYYTIAALLPGDTATPGAPAFTTTATTMSAANAGYVLALTETVGAASDYNIAFALGVTDGTFAIIKAPLTITAANKSKVYGTTDPVLTATYSGFKNSDTTSVVSGFSMNTVTGSAATVG
ncbi:MAG: filamentous hemagglutinin N-terminal domain-containing protein, partial [Bacillota bacterium]